MIELFLKYGADVNEITTCFRTPIDLAVNWCYNNLNLVKLLLKYGAIVTDYCLENDTDKDTKELLNEFKILTDKINKVMDNLKNLNLTEEDRIEEKKQLEILQVKKEELLIINGEITPINKRMEWVEKQEKQVLAFEESTQPETSSGTNSDSEHFDKQIDYCGFKNGFLLSEQTKSKQNEKIENIEKLEHEVQKKRMQKMFCSDQEKVKLNLEIAKILKEIENLKIGKPTNN